MMKTFDALSIIEKINCSAPKLQEMVAEASINARVAQSIYEARTLAGLTQQQNHESHRYKTVCDRTAGRCGL